MKIYLFLLAFLIGIEISIGMLLAPVVFNPDVVIGPNVLTKFQSGQLMSQIFINYGYILIFISALSFIFESSNIRNTMYIFAKRFSLFMLSGINLILAFVFVFYFTDYILEAQKIGVKAIETAEFASIHSASELVMKIMIIAQVGLFFIKISDLKAKS